MRSAVAKQHGLDEDLVAQIGDAASGGDITDAQRAAIELADAMMTRPGDVSDDLRDRLRHHFSREQIIELTLDVMKWNYQKIPVALGVDREVVPGRLTDLVFDDDGNWVRPG